MLLIPIHQRFSRDHLPFVTGLIVLLNVIVYFAWQFDDSEILSQALEQASADGLLEIEAPLYLKFLRDGGQFEQAEMTQALIESEQPSLVAMLTTADLEFLKLMKDGVLLDPESEEYQRWTEARDQFDLARSQTTTERFAFHTDDPGALTLFTSMFLHGGFGHLFGNMIFLVLIGVLVEGALQKGVYLLLYVGSGVLATLFFWLFSPQTGISLVGASGAIAGLMGLYSVLFWTRRVRCFYWAFVYFGTRKAPAIAFLPVWVAWELIQWMLMDGPVAYGAHAGGLLAGASAGLVMRRVGWQDQEFLDHDVRVDRRREGLVEARQQMADMETGRAVRSLAQLATEFPADEEVLRFYYQAARIKANSDAHRAAARAIFEHAGDSHLGALTRETWADYKERTKGKLGLSASVLLAIANCLLRCGDLEQAEVLFQALTSRVPNTLGLDTAILRFARALGEQGQLSQRDQWISFIRTTWPKSPAAMDLG